MLDNLEMDRPGYGYFCRAKIHHSDRPAPPRKLKAVYEDATPGTKLVSLINKSINLFSLGLPADYPRPPAKFGSRVHYMM